MIDHLLEAMMAVSVIWGAFMLSKLEVKEAMASFMVGNFLGLAVAILSGLPGFFVQNAFFIATGALVLISFKLGLKDLLPIITAAIIAMVYLPYADTLLDQSVKMSVPEGMAAVMAIVGSLLMKYGSTQKIAGFILFFVADVVYAFVAIEHAMPFFFAQSLFFLYTSSAGIANALKERSIMAA